MPSIDLFHELQWVATLVTIAAAWFIGSRVRRKRIVGFWLFLLSNALWIAWGWHDHAFALVALQGALAALNFRGVYRNEEA
jgi:hypothetical protein